MAYFPNATAGMVLDDQCEECVHGLSNDVMCPVHFVQVTYNYDQCRPREKKLRTALNILISDDGTCQMKVVLEKVRYLKTVDDDISELERFDREKGRI